MIIFSGQFGFRANHSTEHAPLLITDKIQVLICPMAYSLISDLGLDVLTE